MTVPKFKISKGWKWTIGIFAGICLLLAVGIFWLGYHWKPILVTKIKEAVAEGSDGLYRIDFDDIYINLLTGYIAVEQPSLTADSLVYNRLKKAGKAPEKIFTVRVNRLILKDTHPLSAWLDKEIEIGTITIDRPQLAISAENLPDTIKVKDTRTLYQRISKNLRSVKVGKIFFTDADFRFTDNRQAKPSVTALKNLSVRITGVLIDSATQQDPARFYTARDVFFQIKNYTYATPDGMYKLSAGDLSASTQEGYVRLADFRVIPNYPELRFSYKYKVQHDRYDMTFPEIILNGVDFNGYDADNRLTASKLLIDRGVVKVFLNRALPPPPVDKWVNFPHVLLRSLKIKTTVDSLLIRRNTLYYTEYNPLSGKSGTIFFTAFNAGINNITNDSARLVKNNHSHATLTALVMGKTRVNLFINFNLTDPAGAFTYNGYTQNLDLTSLNAVNRPMSLVEVKSGIVKKAEFNISANRYGASGTVKLRYNDLKITLLKKDGAEGEIRKKGVLSLLANSILVKNDNPDGNEPLRIGSVEFERPHWSSFFNLLWKGVFVGIKESVGLGVVKEKQTQPAEDGRAQKQREKDKKAKEKQAKKERKKAEKEQEDKAEKAQDKRH